MDFPSLLFKYATEENARRLTERGSVAVGTLEYYRREFEYEAVPLRGDKDEGVIHVVGTVERLEASDPVADAPKYEQLKRIGFDVGAANITMLNTSYDASFVEVRPICVYCTSLEFDEKQQALFGGACVEIFEPQLFWRTLSDALAAANRYAGAVEYVDSRTFKPLAVPALNAIWMKPKEIYGDQNEFRLAFELEAPPAKPLLILECESLRDYCRVKGSD